jgi:integrase
LNYSQSLSQLSRKTNLSNPTEVKAYISTAKNEKTMKPLNNGTKNKLCQAYEWFTKANELQWEKPFYKEAEGTPIIPTKEDVTTIITASSHTYTTIFTILAEIGAEGEELHKTHQNKISLERGEITITGTKGHASQTYKLKERTAEMLREYIHNHPKEYPFPQPKVMAQIWRRTRNKVAENLKRPELKNIPMKNLRNYSGAILYLNLPIRDPIAVMRHLRHKKLETTMHYIRGIRLDMEDEAQYISRLSNSLKEDQELIDAGFQYITEREGTKLYRKRK